MNPSVTTGALLGSVWEQYTAKVGIAAMAEIIIPGRADTYKKHAKQWARWVAEHEHPSLALPADPGTWTAFILDLHLKLPADNKTTVAKMQSTCSVIHKLNGFAPPAETGVSGIITTGIKKRRKGPVRRMKPLKPHHIQRIWEKWGKSTDPHEAAMAFYILFTFVLTGRFSCLASIETESTVASAERALIERHRTWQVQYSEQGRKTTPWASTTNMGHAGVLTERLVEFSRKTGITSGPLLRGFITNAAGRKGFKSTVMEYGEFRGLFRECLIDCCPETAEEMPAVGQRAYGTHSQRRGAANAAVLQFPAHVARLHGDWKTWDAFTIYLEGDDEEATELVEYLTGGERQQ